MSNQVAKEHALQAFLSRRAQRPGAVNAGVTVTLHPYLCHTSVRVNPNDKDTLNSIESILHQSLPLQANTVNRGDHAVYWLGPTEWLVVSASANDPYESLKMLSANNSIGVTRLGGGQLLMTLVGSSARALLAKGSTLDFHQREFDVHDCAQSTFAKASALFALQDSQPTFELVVRRSFIDYVAQWIDQAGVEFGVEFVDMSAH